MTSLIVDARAILKNKKQNLLHCSNVVATGIGYKMSEGKAEPELSIVCSVSKKLPLAELSPRDVVPKSFDGIPTDVIDCGIIRAYTPQTQAPQTQRMRPAPGGISIGHTEITAGTLGCLVKRGNDTYILSNNHVLANSNDASAGDAIVQPGPTDGGSDPADRIAALADFVPIHFPNESGGNDSGCAFASGLASGLNTAATMVGSQARLQAITIRETNNLVDAAIAGPVDTSLVDDSILGIGRIQATGEADLGMEIQKSGRTTGYTTGQIQQIEVTANVQYGGGRVAQFTDQLIAGAMSQGGDSGSAVLDMDSNIVGLLFAGSDTVTIMNRIENVFSALDIGL